MNISMQLVVVAAAACLCLAHATPDMRMSRKQQRPTRGFKNVEMMTARGFGKRNLPGQRTEHQQFYAPVRRRFNPKTSLMVAENFGKRSENTDDTVDEVYDLDNFWETLEATAEKENLDFLDEKESIPVDWFVNEMISNPDFARSVVRKFIDVNQDGMLSSTELLRNTA